MEYTEAQLEHFSHLSRTNPEELKRVLADDPETLRIFEFLRIKHDPQEDDPVLKDMIASAHDEAYLFVVGPKNARKLGQCHDIWRHQKIILREKGIDWKSPAEMNPGNLFD